ncbi:hypothetical protein J2Z83_003737 [Virgibacillus natechei]|uniref:Phage capsid protein n=1 Tax=Virgibacillus natechei TaxID=1216297 RepID=A0ABS4IMR3_9BACI|nr:phage capsid protein [Virgibacillus natechei]MBP1971586.1 hypothetical protein [Virgibacillus natechei]UZD13081.1 phage capsid protein [Virgibacillus natechei]
MPVTLEQAKVGMADKIDQFVVDEFRRSSFLLDQLTFDDAVSPGTGGSTLTYGYTRLKTPSTGQFRNINEEYEANQADRENKFVNLKIFGGSFQIDRVIQDTSGQINEMNFQLQQKVKGASNLFHNTVINGDSGADAKSFDGLSKAVNGTSTDLETDINISDNTSMENNKQAFIDEIDGFLSELDGRPTMLMGNNKLITKIKSAARRVGYFTQAEDAFGRTIDMYDGIPLVDLGYFYDGSNSVPIIGVDNGSTDLYAVNLGLDGFHGVSPQGNGVIKTYLPDFDRPGAVKNGDVEMVAAVALKATRKAGRLSGIQIAGVDA